MLLQTCLHEFVLSTDMRSFVDGIINYALKSNFSLIHFFFKQNVINNGSIYLHCYFVKEGKSPDPTDKGKHSKKFTVHRSKRKYKIEVSQMIKQSKH